MEKLLQGKCLLFLLMASAYFSCNYNPTGIVQKNETIKPIWSLRLPGNAGVYNDGLIGLPVYEDKILFHSTFFTNIEDEDNRIHAINIHTGQLEWTYPKSYDSNNRMFFWGVPYLYGDKMIAKMPKFGNYTKQDRIICLNLNNQELMWSLNLPKELSFATCRDVVGVGDNFYCIQETETNAIILRGSVMSGIIDTLFSLNGNDAVRVEITTNNVLLEHIGGRTLMLFATCEKKIAGTVEIRESFFNVLDVNTKKLVSKTQVINDGYYVVSNSKVSNDKVFFTSGRKCYCSDPLNGRLLWNFLSADDVNFTASSILVQDGTVFLWGDNRYIGLNAESGKMIYQGNIECGNAEVFNGYVYIVSRDGSIYILNIMDGTLKAKIDCPNKYFLTGCKPRVFEDKLFLFDYHHAYCYRALPE